MAKKKETQPLQKVEFHYIKGNHFRVIHTDGVIANITPKGKISLCLFSERPAIPKTVEYEIDSEGHLSETSRILNSRSGVVREIDIDVMIDLETAKEIKVLLDKTIKKLEKD